MNFDLLHKTGVFDYSDSYQCNIRRIGDFILKCKPDVIGFYTICNAFNIVLSLVQYIKSKNSKVMIILGGPHASTTWRDCLELIPHIDAIVIGEAEVSIHSILERLLNHDSLAGTPGVAFLENGIVMSPIPMPLIESSDLLEYVVTDFKPFNINSTQRVSVEGGRGCPFECTFCTTSTFWGRKYRIKPTSHIVNEMKLLSVKYGINKFSIMHDMFTANSNIVIEFCDELISLGSPFRWSCSARVDSLDEKLIQKMYQAGCDGIYLGIESGSIRMQEILNKNLDLLHAFELIKFIKKHFPIKIATSFIYCFPDETVQDFMNTIELMEKIIMLGVYQVQLHRFMPLPGTKETIKIMQRMYYDKEVLESTLVTYNIDPVRTMILRYPTLFSQYYTFDSEVKSSFKRFDTFMEVIYCISDFYSNTIQSLISKYTLLGLYNKLKPTLEQIYRLNYNVSISNAMLVTNNARLEKVASLLQRCFLNEVKISDNLYLSEIFSYEKKKIDYFLSDEVTPFIKKFNIDIHKAINEKKLVRKTCYVLYTKRDDSVVTMEIKPVVKDKPDRRATK